MKKIKGMAFTLVELIIVITILAILATIAFVSFQNYVKDSRDTTRLATLKNIESGLQVFQVNTGNYPEPDNKVNIYASGVLIGYQGKVGKNVSNVLRLKNIAQDPLDQVLYTYNTNIEKNKYQLLSLNETNIVFIPNQTYAFDITKRVPKTLGNDLGIIFDSNYIPLEDTGTGVDLVNTNQNYIIYTAGQKISGTGAQLKNLTSQYSLSYAKSCKEILESGLNLGTQKYNINPTGTSTGTLSVFCDMQTDGGGWTLLMKFKSNASELGYNSSYWINDNNLGQLGDNPLSDEDYKTSWGNINGSSLRFCMENGGLKCVNKNYVGNLKSFVNQPTSTQMGYTHSGTTSSTGTQWITNLGFIDKGEIFCDGVHSGAHTKVRIGVNKNDLISQGCNSTDDYAWGFGLHSVATPTVIVGAGVISSTPLFQAVESKGYKGYIYIK